MLARRVLVAILAAAASLEAPLAFAETRSHLEGDVRPAGALVEAATWDSLFNAPGAPLATFSLDAASPELDFRAAPGTLVVSNEHGTLTAVAGDPATLFGVLPRDAESGRPLKAGSAEDATCPTGAEPDCWVLGDPIPADTDVMGALAPFTDPVPFVAYTGTAETQAMLGCGPYFGTACEATGVDLTRAETSVLLQSWPLIGTTQPVIYERIVDPITGRPLPGIRRPGSPVAPTALRVSDGAVRRPVRAGGSALFGRRDFVWVDSMAALSWNYLMLLISQSGDDEAPFEIGEFDPSQPTEPNRCSFATPQFCDTVRIFFLFAGVLLDDDPSAPPTLRMLWEAGALYEVTEATGDFAPYAGGAVHVLGMEEARRNVAQHGIPIVLFPPGDALDPSAPFAVATPDAPESPRFGLAYLTAPEASSASLVAPAVLAMLARRRRSRR